jgi:hypothetical protein
MGVPRGDLHSPARARQLHDFSGLAYGAITPTDVDGLIEYRDKAVALFELKYHGQALLQGQSLALTRMVDNLERAGKRAILLVVDHEEHNVLVKVNAAICLVRCGYTKGRWHTPSKPTTLRAALDFFILGTKQKLLPTSLPTMDDPVYRKQVEDYLASR